MTGSLTDEVGSLAWVIFKRTAERYPPIELMLDGLLSRLNLKKLKLAFKLPAVK
jgi:hypothetical protein